MHPLHSTLNISKACPALEMLLSLAEQTPACKAMVCHSLCSIGLPGLCATVH